MISGLLLLLGTSLAQETGLSASASLNLVRPCERDADCSLTKVIIIIIFIIIIIIIFIIIIIIMIIILTQACVDGGCRDPCSSGSRSVCPMEGGLCKVVGHHDYHDDIFATYYYYSRWSVTMIIIYYILLSFKVVGHRPVCSCPPGTHNLNSTCTSDTSCTFGEKR